MNTTIRPRGSQLTAALFAIVSGAIWFQSTTYAHHSASRFDHRQSVTVTGVVMRVDWANPHVYVHIDETDGAGKKIGWELEGFPPAMLRRMGFDQNTLHIGDTLTVTGSPNRNVNMKEIFPTLIKRGDSTLFTFRETGKTTAPAIAPKTNNLNGIWSTTLTAVAQMASPPATQLTKQGVDALARYDEKTSPTSNCILPPPPSWMFLPELKRISVGKETILIEGESESVRHIHMNVPSHDGAIASLQGHSIGKWEGKTLFVDTTRFAYHGAGNGGGNGIGAGLPSSPRKRLLERFTLSADGTSLTYHFELTDPDYLAEPKVGDVKFTYSPEAKFEIEKCDLDIARRFNKT